ncbi:hypothetical protein Tco_0628301 [Tanacetum coccineum]|uniref:Secreted protein n=1 Tax=Tanacetum coccineum TaxID=301880 RepID=A0ABQ4WPX5_9ASTR
MRRPFATPGRHIFVTSFMIFVLRISSVPFLSDYASLDSRGKSSRGRAYFLVRSFAPTVLGVPNLDDFSLGERLCPSLLSLGYDLFIVFPLAKATKVSYFEIRNHSAPVQSRPIPVVRMSATYYTNPNSDPCFEVVGCARWGGPIAVKTRSYGSLALPGLLRDLSRGLVALLLRLRSPLGKVSLLCHSRFWANVLSVGSHRKAPIPIDTKVGRLD